MPSADFEHVNRFVPVTLVVVLGLLATVAAHRLVGDLEQRELRNDFRRLAADRIAAMKESANHPVALLQTVVALFEASDHVDREAFATFVSPTLERHPGLLSLAWVPRVRADERAELISAARAEGFDGFAIRARTTDGTLAPAAGSTECFPIWYAAGNAPDEIVGFDLASEPVRRAAIERARDTGEPSATARVDLIGLDEEHAGFIMTIPLYDRDGLQTVTQRRAALRGFVVGAFGTSELLRSALAPFNHADVDVALFDRSAPAGLQALAASRHGPKVLDEMTAASPWTVESEFPFGGRTWAVVVRASARFLAGWSSPLAWTVLLGGLLFTVLLGGYTSLIVGRAARIESIVDQRTSELAMQADELEQAVAERSAAEDRDRRGSDMLQAIAKAQEQFIAKTEPKELFDNLLSSLLEVTESGYGFIGEILRGPDDVPYLKTHAITNIAWNAQTREFFEKNAPSGLEFRNLKTLFGSVITSGQPVIANRPHDDPRRGGLPEGHPEMRCFLGVPFYLRDRMIGMVGVANRPQGYDEQLVAHLRPLLNTCAQIIDAYRNDQRRRRAEAAVQSVNDELTVMNSSLEERNREVMQLAYAITHDLQTPLATLTGSVDALCRRLPDASGEQEQWLGRIRRSSGRMVDMLDDLMVFAKAGQENLTHELVDLGEAVATAVEELRLEAQARGVELEISVERSLVRADEPFLLRVMVNLIGNAVKYSRADSGGRVRIAATHQEALVRLTVEDNGPGINPARLEEVFQPFKRASIERQGTGLGLAIVRKYVEAIGGRVWLESDGRSGTVAVVQLPAAGVESLEPDQAGAAS
ncbi:MAG: CHASE domain-containing protein [Planctomycetota bacterium]